jgi:pantoate--beta-alanine ligase
LSDILCGVSRPLFFTGVATVVNRLFNLVQPDVAYFGRKDYQQLQVIRKMVEDLAIPVDIRGIDTVREDDGLAMSSRNNYLNDKQRSQASKLYKVLQDSALQYTQDGEKIKLESAARDRLTSYGFRPDYLEIRRSVDLAVPDSGDRELIVLAAAWLGNTRLIDNLVFTIDE